MATWPSGWYDNGATGTSAQQQVVWLQWTSTCGTASTILSADIATASVWHGWLNNQTYATGGTSNVIDATWLDWQNTAHTTGGLSYPRLPAYTPRELTPEEQAERERQRAEQAERQRQIAETRAEARRKARELLLECLSDEEREEYDRDRVIRVRTARGEYRLGGSSPAVSLHDDIGVVESYCIHHYGGEPLEDTQLAQKLLLETDEEAFLRIANVTRFRPRIEATPGGVAVG